MITMKMSVDSIKMSINYHVHLVGSLLLVKWYC